MAIRAKTPVMIATALALGALPAAVGGQSPSADPDDEWITRSPVRPADDFDGPRQHFRLADPATLSASQAENLYARLRLDMARSYRFGGVPGSGSYQRWQRYNKTPYRSATHGRRLVNNYANDKAVAYGRYEDSGPLPVGAILAKDSISVTENGGVSPGPLFLMEKMPAGFEAASGDWRYTMIMPDGTVFGITNSDNSERVEFCTTCHMAAEDNDYLFFMPQDQRR